MKTAGRYACAALGGLLGCNCCKVAKVFAVLAPKMICTLAPCTQHRRKIDVCRRAVVAGHAGVMKMGLSGGIGWQTHDLP